MLRFDKWYFDAQAPGRLVYGWLAEMTLFGRRIGLVQANLVGPGGATRNVLARYPAREVSIGAGEFRVGPNSIREPGDGRIELALDLAAEGLGGSLVYRPASGPWRPEPWPLWERRGRRIEWSVPVPRGEVEGRVGSFEGPGTGYLDRVALDVAPWAIPFRRLWWGRVFAEDRTVVFLRAEPRGPGAAIESGLDGGRPIGRVAVEVAEGAWTVRLDGSPLALAGPRPVKDEAVVDGIGVRGRISRAIQGRLSGAPVQRRFVFDEPGGLLAVAERVEWNWA